MFKGDVNWRKVKAPQSQTYAWDNKSTYVQNPPYFKGITMQPKPVDHIEGARVLALFGDKITTDHISPGRFDQGGLARRQISDRATR